jgi:ABC-type Fe3+-siderophore transport system permease subunit
MIIVTLAILLGWLMIGIAVTAFTYFMVTGMKDTVKNQKVKKVVIYLNDFLEKSKWHFLPFIAFCFSIGLVPLTIMTLFFYMAASCAYLYIIYNENLQPMWSKAL